MGSFGRPDPVCRYGQAAPLREGATHGLGDESRQAGDMKKRAPGEKLGCAFDALILLVILVVAILQAIGFR